MADNDKSKKGGKPQGGAPSPQGGPGKEKAPKVAKGAKAAGKGAGKGDEPKVAA